MINILWDASHFWGYLLLHAMQSSGLPYRLLKAEKIAQAGLTGKVLIVPGGSARRKAQALGPIGQGAVRRFVAEGGHYLGFCGGAGLALREGLGLCSWSRGWLPDRLQHFISGHINCRLTPDHPLLPAKSTWASLPVWWPSRFDESPTRDVEVLARYQSAGEDLYVADLPYALVPAQIRAEWQTLYGVDLHPSLLENQPCVIAGKFERGDWVLSYSHLETPQPLMGNPPENLLNNSPLPGNTVGDRSDTMSSEINSETANCAPGNSTSGNSTSGNSASGNYISANAVFFHLLGRWLGRDYSLLSVPEWEPAALPLVWEDATLAEAGQRLDNLLAQAAALNLLFTRRPWLQGWRAGIPGAQINGLAVALKTAQALPPIHCRLSRWQERSGKFMEQFKLFEQAASSWLLARRLADTLSDAKPGLLPKTLLEDQRQMLFGTPMAGNGLCGLLQFELEELLFCED